MSKSFWRFLVASMLQRQMVKVEGEVKSQHVRTKTAPRGFESEGNLRGRKVGIEMLGIGK